MITADWFLDRAVEKAGLDDFGDGFSTEPLVAWVEDLAHPRLGDDGRAICTSLMVTDLVRRLHVVECWKRNPEIADVEIPPIVYISGLERTGTTFLHNLLGLQRGARPMLRWELMRPTPPPTSATYADDPRIARTQASIDRQRGTLLEQMHWVDADDPEECQWGMLDGSSLLGGAVGTAMPNWSAWVEDRDPRTGYAEYRRVLQLLLWKNPVGPQGYLVLKCPQFAGSLGTFAEVFPEARFVLTHRDPFRAIVSVCTLVQGILESFVPDPDELRSMVLESMPSRAERRLGVLAAFADSEVPVANVAYPDLVADPVGVLDAIAAVVDVDGLEIDAGGVEAFIAAQRGGRRAAPPPSLPDFGLDHDAFLARPAIAAACEHFGIAPEVVRQTG